MNLRSLAFILTVFIVLLGLFLPLARESFRTPGPRTEETPLHEPVVTIKEVYRTPDFPNGSIDSLALWRNSKGGALLYLSDKETDEIHVCDGVSGERLTTFGGTGRDLGQLSRPNGLAVHENLLFVVERDNHRVQVFDIPSNEPLIAFGRENLEVPYGLTLFASGDSVMLYVTDDYPVPKIGPADEDEHQIPPSVLPPTSREMLTRRVKRFSIRSNPSGIQASFLGAFGETSPEGALHKVECIQADPNNDNIFICDEATRSVKVYSLDGRFKGKSVGLGLIRHDPEGLALIEDSIAPSGGYLIVTDQGLNRTLFRLFSRDGVKYYRAYTGQSRLSNTDGIVFSPGELGPFKGGALYAVHDDLRVQGYAWGSFEIPR